MQWEFPTSTCEVPVEGYPRQPWSSMATALTIGILLSRKRTKLAWSIVMFELIHLAAHVTYSKELSLLQHFASYPILYHYAGTGRCTNIAIVLDLIAVVFLGGIYQVLSGFMVFYTCTITDIRVKIGGGLVLLLIVNESVLCAHMLQFAMLPYHCAVEIVGMYVFYNMVQERHKTA